MLKPRQFSGLMPTLEISINISFKKVDLNLKIPRTGLEKILKIKKLCFRPQKKDWPPFNLDCLKLTKLARRKKNIAETATANKAINLKKTPFQSCKLTL